MDELRRKINWLKSTKQRGGRRRRRRRQRGGKRKTIKRLKGRGIIPIRKKWSH